MAYYDALITAWNGATQPPSGVTGTALTGLSTSAKLAAVNAWTVTGSVPTNFFVTGTQLLNCIDKTEFLALTAQQQSNLLALCNNGGQILGGSANTSHIAPGLFLSCFTNVSGPTIVALTALAKAAITPWWQSNGYPRTFDLGDVAAAGLS